MNGKEKEKLIRQLEESQDGAGVHVLERFFSVWSWFLFFGREGKGETGADGPVPEERRQVKKGKMVTQVCSMSAVVYLSHTAVCLMKRSSSRLPCGSELESLNLSVYSFDLVAYSSARLHFIAAAVRLHYAAVVCMIIEISLSV